MRERLTLRSISEFSVGQNELPGAAGLRQTVGTAMLLFVRIFFVFVLTAAAFVSSSVAQALEFDSGIHTFPSFPDTAVTLSGQCELHLTTTGDPAPRSTIDFQSENAWLFLPNIRPSVVASSYL